MLNLEDDESSQLKIVHFLCQGFQLREQEHTLMVHEKCKALFRNGSTGPGAGRLWEDLVNVLSNFWRKLSPHFESGEKWFVIAKRSFVLCQGAPLQSITAMEVPVEGFPFNNFPA